jgi:HlyD family secretion protein
MDVARAKPRKLPRRLAVALCGVVLAISVPVALISLTRVKGGVVVDRASVVTDTVKLGTLSRSISASGALAPQEVHIVAAVKPGTVESVFVKPGAYVTAQTPIAQLSNPDLEEAIVAARSSVDVAQADLSSAEQQAKAAALAQRSAYTSAQAQAEMDQANLSVDDQLRRQGYIADQSYRIASIKATQSKAQFSLAHSQIDVDAAEQDAKITAAHAELEQAQAQVYAKEAEIDALVVRARTAGIVQSVAVDPGAVADAGTEIARVADQHDLKAVLQVPEGQVHAVNIGMPVLVDTGNGSVTGHIARIAPAAQDGSVAVDVSFGGALPAGARPDLNVGGTIELQTLRGVLSIARPTEAADDTTVSLYKVEPRSALARQVQVRLGVGSSDRIEVLAGLAAGDEVIVSDTSAYGGAPLLRLH